MLPYNLFEKYIYILALETASPGNQHCVSCIGTLSFPISLLTSLDRVVSSGRSSWPRTRAVPGVDSSARLSACTSAVSSRPEASRLCCARALRRHTAGRLPATDVRKKGKGSPYSTAERRVPELIPLLGSQPAGDASHKSDGRLPLLSARPAVTPATLKRAATNFAA